MTLRFNYAGIRARWTKVVEGPGGPLVVDGHTIGQLILDLVTLCELLEERGIAPEASEPSPDATPGCPAQAPWTPWVPLLWRDELTGDPYRSIVPPSTCVLGVYPLDSLEAIPWAEMTGQAFYPVRRCSPGEHVYVCHRASQRWLRVYVEPLKTPQTRWLPPLVMDNTTFLSVPEEAFPVL